MPTSVRQLLLTAIVLLCICPGGAYAQLFSGGNTNQYDRSGLKHGFWYIQEAPSKGEEGQSIFGHFSHGKRNGLWYTHDNRGNIISIENYRNDVRDGEAKYFENGRIVCTGTYRGLNPLEKLDTFNVVFPQTGEERIMIVPTERGSVRHGSWRFYNEISGRLIREEYYQADELIYRQDFVLSAADSTQYAQWEKSLPHRENTKAPASKFRPKTPTKSLIR